MVGAVHLASISGSGNSSRIVIPEHIVDQLLDEHVKEMTRRLKPFVNKINDERTQQEMLLVIKKYLIELYVKRLILI